MIKIKYEDKERRLRIWKTESLKEYWWRIEEKSPSEYSEPAKNLVSEA